MSKTNLKSDPDEQNETIRFNPETRNLIRKARGPRKTLKERMDEFDDRLKKEEESKQMPKPMSPIHINPDEERGGPGSARSHQKLIMSDEEAQNEILGRRRRGPRRNKEAIAARAAMAETNLDEMGDGGKVNPAFEDTEIGTSRTDGQPGTGDGKEEDPTKPRKRARRAKKMSEPMETAKDPSILAVIIHQTDKLRTDVNIYHPVVRIHLLDLDSDGQYVKKTRRERHVSYYYEKENRNLDHISSLTTSPFDFKENRTIIPRWEERVVFNEEFSHFVQEHPNVLIMFELLDSYKSDEYVDGQDSQKKPTQLGEINGRTWQRIAWAFLKVVGSDKSLNVGKKIRLQLYYSQPQFRNNMFDSIVPEIYTLYKNGPRVKYPASLHVTVRPIHPAKRFYLGIGSSYMIDEEENMVDGSAADLKKAAGGGDDDDGDPSKARDEGQEAAQKLKKKTVIWSRLPGKACNVPNELAMTLPSSKYGCYSVKFSTSGSYLACACVEEDNTYPIVVYEIPEGNFHCKFLGHFGIVYEIAWSNLDKYILTASHDATVRIFEFESKSREALKILPHPSFIYSAKFHPHSFETVCTAGYDKVIRVWTIGNKRKVQKYGELLQELTGHPGYINSICFSNDGNFLYSSDSLGQIKIWNCWPVGEMEFKQWSFREEILIDELKNQCISYIQTHPNRFSILIQTRDNQLKLIDTRVKMVVQRYKGTFNFSQNLKSTMSPCGTFLFNSGSDTKIYCWNIISGDLVANPIVLNYMKPARDIDFHPYDNYIAFCSYETRAPIYVFKYNPRKATHEVVQSAPNFILESDILLKPVGEVKTPRAAVMEAPDHLSRHANVNDRHQGPFTYTGPKNYSEIVVALYDYTAQRSDELDFLKGDEIIVFKRENENWCVGELAKNRSQGYFPANYVQDKSLFIKNRANMLKHQPPKYSVVDAMLDIQRVYDQNAFEPLGIKRDPLKPGEKSQPPTTGNREQPNPTVREINEVPTKDETEMRARRRDGSKRRPFAHTIEGSDVSHSEV